LNFVKVLEEVVVESGSVVENDFHVGHIEEGELLEVVGEEAKEEEKPLEVGQMILQIQHH
jgi:hypothetical protein